LTKNSLGKVLKSVALEEESKTQASFTTLKLESKNKMGSGDAVPNYDEVRNFRQNLKVRDTKLVNLDSN